MRKIQLAAMRRLEGVGENLDGLVVTRKGCGSVDHGNGNGSDVVGCGQHGTGSGGVEQVWEQAWAVVWSRYGQ